MRIALPEFDSDELDPIDREAVNDLWAGSRTRKGAAKKAARVEASLLRRLGMILEKLLLRGAPRSR
jgi:hypothetical protein